MFAKSRIIFCLVTPNHRVFTSGHRCFTSARRLTSTEINSINIRLRNLFFRFSVSVTLFLKNGDGERVVEAPSILWSCAFLFKNLYNDSLNQPISSQVHGQRRGCWTWSLYLFSLLVPFERWWLVGCIGVPEWSGGLRIKSDLGVLVVGCWKARDELFCVGVAGHVTGTGRNPRSVRSDCCRSVRWPPVVPPPPYEPICPDALWGCPDSWAVGVGDLSSLIPHSFDFVRSDLETVQMSRTRLKIENPKK